MGAILLYLKLNKGVRVEAYCMFRNNKNDSDEFNRQSIIKLNKKNPFVVKTNPGFFEQPNYGYQEFDVVTKNNKNYLKVERSIVHNNKIVDLNSAAYYELDEDSVITGKTETVNKNFIRIMQLKK